MLSKIWEILEKAVIDNCMLCLGAGRCDDGPDSCPKCNGNGYVFVTDVAQEILALIGWTNVEDGLPTVDIDWTLLEVVNDTGQLQYRVMQLTRVTLEHYLQWDDLKLLRWQEIHPPEEVLQ